MPHHVLNSTHLIFTTFNMFRSCAKFDYSPILNHNNTVYCILILFSVSALVFQHHATPLPISYLKIRKDPIAFT